MYNMYSWDQPASSADEQTEQAAVATAARETKKAAGNGKAMSDKASSAVQAVQVALDRRDNGGDAGPRRGR